MIQYNIYNKGDTKLFHEIARERNVSEVVARIMVNRDIPIEEMGDYLNPDLNKLGNPYLLTDVSGAADMIKDAIYAGSKIRIIGDYDIDGIMSTYILIDALRTITANVDYQIPHRIEDGYGLNESIIRRAIDDGVNLIVTCDNGVSAISEIELARQSGIDVIVTDHHEFMHDESGEIRPDANYVVNPKRVLDKYPFKKLCGAVVAWKLITVLFDICDVTPHMLRDSEYMTYDGHLDVANDQRLEPVMKYIGYAAFATIGDVMELTGENRTIVRYGLKALRDIDNPGLRCLISSRVKESDISSYHIGFILGPCINASGRLDTATKSLKLLMAKSFDEAASLTDELISLNEERRLLTQEGVNKAIDIVDKTLTDDKVLVVYMDSLHESVAGIVAGRLRERYSKPTIVLCDSDTCIKGSGRSIDGYNMYEELLKCKELFIKFGGHPMAAGMSLDKDNIEGLRHALNANTTLTDSDLREVKLIDMTMNLSFITPRLIEELENLEPFGNGNSKPLFAKKNVRIISAKRIGQGKYFKLELAREDGGSISALYFRDADELEDRMIDAHGKAEWGKVLRGVDNNITATIMFYPKINEYRGSKSVQIVLSDVII